MKQTLEFPAKHINNQSFASLVNNYQDSKLQGKLILRSVDGMGKVNEITWDLVEANELREWLNKNLVRI